MQQPAIARLEAGDHEPSLATLARLARGLGLEFHIDITPVALGLRETGKVSRGRGAIAGGVH